MCYNNFVSFKLQFTLIKMAALSENNFSDVKKSITGLREKVDSLDNGTAEKIKTLKKSIMELEDK